METVAATCKLVPNNGTMGGSWLIALNDKKDQKTQKSEKESGNSTLKIYSGETVGREMQINEILPTDPENLSDDAPWRPTVDGTMHCRPNHFTQSSRNCWTSYFQSKLSNSSATTSNLVASALGNKLEKADKHQVAAFSYVCFIMSWMSKLLASYNECKISFMSSHHRKGKSLAKSSTLLSSFISLDAKSKHEILNFMLCVFIPTGHLSQPNTTESQKKLAIASWAIMVLVVLCHEPNSGKEPSDVVTHTHLSFRLLAAAPFAQRPSTSPSEAPIQIAKIMLEKNFAALLSNALADVDLNFPSVQRLLNSILRPLEHFTKAVTKISQASSKQKGGDSTAAPASMIEMQWSFIEIQPLVYTKANWSPETEIICHQCQKKRINFMMTMQIWMIWMMAQCLPQGDDQNINADCGSVANEAHTGNDGFKGCSLDICDKVVIDTGVANRARRFGWLSRVKLLGSASNQMLLKKSRAIQRNIYVSILTQDTQPMKA
ncbi:hypothetical protein VP01_4490g1 [Puccinia sorghi]|uniref:Uncharacterized protein n=1 Tax=Puccinia sorghi TaxID=27349 RepID=A0A0L6UP71_9BASI|nr:hypothetical protein VP01_4490g1 [Puccinia sorghi]